MSHDHGLKRAGRAALTCVVAGALALPVWGVVHADTIEEHEQNIEELRRQEQEALDNKAALEAEAQAAQEAQAQLEVQVQEAQAQLEALYAEAEACENDLITITVALQQTEARISELDAQIEQTRAELKKTKQDLANIISDNYKNGRPTLLSVALSASDFDDFVARITYANKVSQHETDVINQIADLERQLEQQRDELKAVRETQQQQKAEQEQRKAALEEAVASVEAYKAQLSEEIVARIAQAEEALRQAAAEEARAQEAQAQRLAEEEAKRQAEEEARRAAEEEARRAEEERRRAAAEARQSAVPSDDNEYEEDTGGYSSGYVGDVSSFVGSAYSIIGSAYSYSGYHWTGSVSSSWFTCSGVVDFALGRPPRASSPETLYAEVGSRLVFSTSQLNYGDLVFYATGGRYPGHVGIYIGGGSIIDAIPGGVAIRSVGYLPFIGGGPIL